MGDTTRDIVLASKTKRLTSSELKSAIEHVNRYP